MRFWNKNFPLRSVVTGAIAEGVLARSLASMSVVRRRSVRRFRPALRFLRYGRLVFAGIERPPQQLPCGASETSRGSVTGYLRSYPIATQPQSRRKSEFKVAQKVSPKRPP